MLYLDESNLSAIGIDWRKTIDVIEETVGCLTRKDYAQPVKPYLRYGDPKNRIIAMPAFVGGRVRMAGIKWIASFPGNVARGMARAHSVVILNNADTGEPVAIILTVLLSVIRTASVSGLVLRYFVEARNPDRMHVGIIGFGPIGQYHLRMCTALLGDRIAKISLYDVRPIDPALLEGYQTAAPVTEWEAAYLDADVVITCTVADAPYIDKKPKPGSLHLNVSLRDYTTGVYEWFKDAIIVDDWEEVCREKTDIERMHLEKGLRKEDAKLLVEVVHGNCLAGYASQAAVLFNPMGMAVFDVAMGNYYYQAEKKRIAR